MSFKEPCTVYQDLPLLLEIPSIADMAHGLFNFPLAGSLYTRAVCFLSKPAIVDLGRAEGSSQDLVSQIRAPLWQISQS